MRERFCQVGHGGEVLPGGSWGRGSARWVMRERFCQVGHEGEVLPGGS